MEDGAIGGEDEKLNVMWSSAVAGLHCVAISVVDAGTSSIGLASDIFDTADKVFL